MITSNRKKAFIDQVLLGFFLIATTITFVATVSDELKARNKYTQLKKIVQTAALSSSKYYIKQNSTTSQAENIALAIIDKTSLGNEVKNNITFTWDFNSEPNFVKTKIENYKQDMFWYKLLGMDSYTFDNIEAKANIIVDNKSATDFLPIAINGCNNNFQVGENYNFILKAHDQYEDDDHEGWYALSTPSGGQSSFSHFKDIIKKSIEDKHSDDFFRVDEEDNKLYMDDDGDHDGDGKDDDENDDEHITVSTVDSNSIENDIKQISQAFDIKHYDESLKFSIAVLDCNSSANEPILKDVIKVSLNKPSCASTTSENNDDEHNDDGNHEDNNNDENNNDEHNDDGNHEDNNDDENNNDDGDHEDNNDDEHNDDENIQWSDSCNNADLFRIDFDILEDEDTKSILEY